MTKQPDYFKTFCKVSKAFSTVLSTEKLLDLIVESAIETMNARAACLFLADEEKDIFVPVAQKGLSDNYLHAKPMHARTIVNAILKGGYLYIRDATSDPRVENHEAKRAEGIASILDVPVMVRDKAIGVLALYAATIREFSDDEIDFVSALAEQGGMAVERARLLDRIQKNSALFLQLASSINSSLDIKKILQKKTDDQEAVLRKLRIELGQSSLAQGDVVRGFQELIQVQSEQFQELTESFSRLFGNQRADHVDQKKP